MLPDNPPAATGATIGDRMIRLVSVAGRLCVAPPATAARPVPFDPFPLPRLPLSTLAWCGAAVSRFRRLHRRCLATALLLDRSMRRWLPLLPTQACGRHRPIWDLLDSDYAHLPRHVLIAGSFQSVSSVKLFDAQRVVQPYDGIHAVELLADRARRRRSWLFVRAGHGEAELLGDPTALVVDDLETAMRDATGRLDIDSAR